MNNKTCMTCGRPLLRDEIALHRKIINRGAQEFLCLSCIAERFKVSEEMLQHKIRRFKADGCTLFFI